jgi:transmembrane sensor
VNAAIKKLQPSIALHEDMKAYKELYVLLFSFEKHFPRFNSQLLNSSSSITQVVDSEEPLLVNDTPRRKYSRLWWVAGSAAVLSFWLISRANIDKSPELINNTVSTKSGFKTSVSLPDGSKISLNANSILRSWEIHFNVRSNDTDKETETSLVHGSVEVTITNNPDKKIVLKPGGKFNKT